MKKMIILCLTLTLWLGFSAEGWGQTTLTAADLAVIGMDTGSEDFSFVAFVNLDANTQIYFTDEEADGDYSIGTGEGTVLYTAPTGGVLAGTVITYVGNSTNFTITSDGVITLGNSGDGLIAYQGSSVGTVTTFLHAIGENSSLIGTFPVGFTNYMTFGNDDGEYDGTRTGTATALMTSINNSSNWTVSGSGVIPFNTSAFTISSGSSNSITTGAVSTAPFCITASTGASGTVAYTSSGSFTGTFTAQLSDASGSFASPTSIGTGTSPISITIPAGTASGTGYKIRVVNSDPATTGSESSTFAVIYNPYPVTSLIATPTSGQISLSWTNPVGCFDKVIVIGKEGSAVNSDYASANLNGLADGGDFTAGNGDWSARSDENDMTDLTALGVDNEDYLLYNGTGNTVTITGLSNGVTYHFRVLVVKDAGAGSLWSTGADGSSTPAVLPSLTEIILPQYIQGLSGTNNSRIPFVYRARLENLLPSTTYRYFNQIVISSDGAATNGAGNVIFAKTSGDFVRSTGPSMSTGGNYAEFTTDGTGAYTGWFVNEPTGNVRFAVGNDIYMRVMLNDGNAGTTVVTWLTTTSTIKVINFGTNSANTDGTGFRGTSSAPAKDFVFFYDNTSGTGRPLCSGLIESDGTSGGTAYPSFYQTDVDAINGAWGTIIPNVNANGIRRIERRLLSTGAIGDGTVTDADGVWESLIEALIDTRNPTGGSATPLVIPDDIAPLPVELTSFTAKVIGGKVNLNWATATEVNNYGFEVERSLSSHSSSLNGHSLPAEWEKVGFVAGSGNSNSVKEYSFTDSKLSAGKLAYRLKQIDNDGSFAYSKEVEVLNSKPSTYQLHQNFPNPFNPSTVISYQLPVSAQVSLKVYDVLGNEVASLVNLQQEAGSYNVTLDASTLASGTYIYRLIAGDYVAVKKMAVLK
ncbi:MAG: T9SS type A sorting domain-containing protein [Ignavibacteriaceae bacterium]